MRKYISSFTCLNLTQFFSAVNDNLYKLLLVFFLITLKGQEHSNTILSIAGAVFVLPFLLFAALSGSLADRFSKRSIIYFTRFLEIITMSLAVIAFLLKTAIGGYAILFLMATQSSLFSPCKYGIIPEIVEKERISHFNGIITATTYLAIILGTFFASFITQLTNKNFVLAASSCILIALFGAASSLGIEKTKPQAAKKKVSTHFLLDIIRSLIGARKQRYLLTTILIGAYFLFMGAYTQLNIIPFTLESLGLTEIEGGYLFLMTAVGIGIGSFLAGRISGREVELGFVPLAAIGVTFCFVCIYFFNTHFFVVVPFLVFLGFFGGFYIVPIDAFIQVASFPGDRGQNVATSNFLSFLGVILASFLLALLGNGLGLKAAEGFLVVGILTFLLAILLFLLYADQVLRLLVAIWARFFCRIRVQKKYIPIQTPILLVAPRTSWLDTVIIMATLPRLIRYIVPLAYEKKKRSFLYKLLCLIPIDFEHFSPVGSPAIDAIKKELETGNAVCLMHPVDFPSKTLKEWEETLNQLLKDIQVPVMPIHITRKVAPKQGRWWSQLKTLTHGVIKISYNVEFENHIPTDSGQKA